MTLDPADEDGFGIYVHWPFCEARCPYCDFNAYAGLSFDQEEWRDAYLKSLDHALEETRGRKCVSVFFGGGTPSLLEPRVVAAIIDRAGRNWSLDEEAEITLEANPSSSERARFSEYGFAGVNRISIGVQSLSDDGLRQLGRLHDAREARLAFDAAPASFGRVSIDLIYGRQHQGLQEWREELTEALDWEPQHLSAYQLTIEPSTAFGMRHRAGRLQGLPSEELAAKMQEATVEACQGHGYRQYEVSNYALPGGESLHNLLYWRGRDYLGIGPGAHGRITVEGRRSAVETILSPKKWLGSVFERGHGEASRYWLDPETQSREYLMMSLRLTEGTDLEVYTTLAGRPLAAERVAGLEELGLVKSTGSRLMTTGAGSLVINSIIAELLS